MDAASLGKTNMDPAGAATLADVCHTAGGGFVGGKCDMVRLVLGGGEHRLT